MDLLKRTRHSRNHKRVKSQSQRKIVTYSYLLARSLSGSMFNSKLSFSSKLSVQAAGESASVQMTGECHRQGMAKAGSLTLPICIESVRQDNVDVIGTPVTALSFDQQMTTILSWAKSRLSKIVLVANVHMLVEGVKDSTFATILKRADLVTPDGMPLVWMIKKLTGRNQERVAGMDILLSLCKSAEAENVGVYFFGSTPKTLDTIREKLTVDFPNLPIAGMETLPFAKVFTPEQDQQIVQSINQSGAGIVFVALGCPKQERWMFKNREHVRSVMIGVGGAFPVYAGLKKWAPRWVRQSGLEWLYRFLQEPRRLWKRYLVTNSHFIWLALKQVLVTKPTHMRN